MTRNPCVSDRRSHGEARRPAGPEVAMDNRVHPRDDRYPENWERRKDRRYPARSGAFASVRNNGTKVGQVANISKGASPFDMLRQKKIETTIRKWTFFWSTAIFFSEIFRSGPFRIPQFLKNFLQLDPHAPTRCSVCQYDTRPRGTNRPVQPASYPARSGVIPPD